MCGLCTQPEGCLLLSQTRSWRRAHLRSACTHKYLLPIIIVNLCTDCKGSCSNGLNLNSLNISLCPFTRFCRHFVIVHCWLTSALLPCSPFWPEAAHSNTAGSEQCDVCAALPGEALPQSALWTTVWQPASASGRGKLRQPQLHRSALVSCNRTKFGPQPCSAFLPSSLSHYSRV